MNKKRLNKNGLTLVELLTVIAFMGFITVFITTITIQSLWTTDEIRTETAIRDEADLMISNFIKEISQTKREYIVSNETSSNGSYLNILKNPSKCKKSEDGKWILNNQCTTEKYGFVSNSNGITLYVKNEPYQITNQNISISNGSKINGNPEKDATFEIILKLQYKNKRGGKIFSKEITFTNTIQPF